LFSSLLTNCIALCLSFFLFLICSYLCESICLFTFRLWLTCGDDIVRRMTAVPREVQKACGLSAVALISGALSLKILWIAMWSVDGKREASVEVIKKVCE
jgi:hypothetical protein